MIPGGESSRNERIIARVEPHLENILPGFLARRREDVESMREVADRVEVDYEAIRSFGHRMKGTGGAYGLDAISDMGRTLEDAAKAQDAMRIKEVLGRFSDYLERVQVEYL